MRYGAIISGALHALILILVIVGLPNLLKSERPDMTPISVEIVTLDEKAQQREPQERAKPEPPKPKATQKPAPAPEAKPEPPKQTARETPPPAPVAPPPPPLKVPAPEPLPAEKPVPKPEAKPAPPPEPDPAPQPKAKPVPPKPAPPEKKVVAAAPETPAPTPRRKPAPPPDEFQALLKNLAKEKRKQVEEKKAEAPVAAARPAPAAPARSALQTQMAAASLAQAVMRQVSPCWNIPAGAKDAANMSVDIRIRLNPDGALGGQPKVEDAARLGRDPFFRAVAESALRALRNPRCMPLKLPYDQYDVWKEITFVFDPSTALGQ